MNILSCQRMMVACTFSVCWLSGCVVPMVAFGDPPGSFSAGEFDREVAPILIRNCLDCHYGSDPSGGLDLSSRESFAGGGESGRVVDADDPGKSLLWQKISPGEMPPESKLSKADRARLLNWVEAGAPWSDRTLDRYELTTNKRGGYDWWSLQPIVDPPVPRVANEVANPIDAFVIKRLTDAGLAMSPRADARTLVRRLLVKLHGIHADTATVLRLEKNDSPETFDALVSRNSGLASLRRALGTALARLGPVRRESRV